MAKTNSELLFEEYLISQGLNDFEYEKEHAGKSKRPDYIVRIDGQEYIFDVKEFAPPPYIEGFRAYDSLPPVREKINQVAKQFKEFKDRSCCLVLYNNGDPYVHLQDADDMLGAMYGDLGIAWDFDVKAERSVPDSERLIFGRRGKMIRPNRPEPQNTTISAIITLRHVRIGQMRYRKFIRDLREQGSLEDNSIQFDYDIDEEHVGVIVWENVFARIPFPRDLFCGPYDERYGADGEYIKWLLAGTGILEIEEMNENRLDH